MGTPSLRQIAYETIRTWLNDGDLPKGAVTSEVELSRKLDMSRTPVRAALQQLETEGFVAIAPKHGVLVLDSSAGRVGDLLDVLASLVLFALERAEVEEPGRLSVQAARLLEELDRLGGGEAMQAEPEALSRFEYGALRELVASSRNAEMERLFERTAARLYWEHNERRWKQPFRQAASEKLTVLLSGLRGDARERNKALFAYFRMLKHTWS